MSPFNHQFPFQVKHVKSGTPQESIGKVGPDFVFHMKVHLFSLKLKKTNKYLKAINNSRVTVNFLGRVKIPEVHKLLFRSNKYQILG